MKNQKKSTEAIFLKDYQEPSYFVDQTDLKIELGEEQTIISSNLRMRANHTNNTPLILNGEELELVSLKLNEQELPKTQYGICDNSLKINELPKDFSLQIVTRIFPQKNTTLEGLYKSSANFCTQCEAEGFRKITYYLDRPDVMSKFTTTIIGDKTKYPILLSNGNLIEAADLSDNLHMARWQDPFKKPSYLFAVVAGDLALVEDSYTTKSGKKVMLKFYVEHGNEDKCSHAIWSLQQSMKWDEETFGLEYDLDIYMVVAVSDFNMGAMENKGLNVFNTKYVLAKPQTATDADYRNVLSVIGHEYFHNYTGNRVTCRDWFQLSLKEGLTVFRDQEFSSDLGSRAVNRINNVKALRASQFIEDQSPTAHCVRPESYMKIDNFYTSTIYNKGAEVIRMMSVLLNKTGFRKGMDLYFERHDGQAVTCDDFVAAMSDANDFDLSQFKLWYSQAGTPVVKAKGVYDADAKTYTLEFKQSCPATPGQSHKKPFHMPIKVGLLDAQGKDLLDENTILELKERAQSFTFENIAQKPVPSILREFCAPIKIDFEYSDDEYLHLFAHDSDSFNKWEAGQKIVTKIILADVACLQREQKLLDNQEFIDATYKTLGDSQLNNELKALAISLPSESYIAESMKVIDVDNIHTAREHLRRTIASQLGSKLLKTYRNSIIAQKDKTKDSIGHRALANTALAYLACSGFSENLGLCKKQFEIASNMTNKAVALSILADFDCEPSTKALQDFYNEFSGDALVIDKWFSIQALSKRSDVLATVKRLMKHKDFSLKNPNRLRSLIGAFCVGNIVAFHVASGAGYDFLGDQIIEIDSFNPQIAARLLSPLTSFRRYDKNRQELMRVQLERICNAPKSSLNVNEIVGKSLD